MSARFIKEKLNEILRLCPLGRDSLEVTVQDDGFLLVTQSDGETWKFNHYQLAKVIGNRVITCTDWIWEIPQDNTDLETMLHYMDSTGKPYHKVVSEEGYTCVAFMGKGDSEGIIYVAGYGHYPLKDGNQLSSFVEFSPDGSTASISEEYMELCTELDI